VILHVDHIVAASCGGDAENENLITSCRECNLGKSNVPLKTIIPPLREKIKEERERAAQVTEYNEWLRQINAIREAEFNSVSDALMAACGEEPGTKIIAGSWARTVRALLKRMPSELIIESVQIADDRFSFRLNTYKSFKYFCGVCWRRIGRMEGTES
jgi:hypothetical protein